MNKGVKIIVAILCVLMFAVIVSVCIIISSILSCVGGHPLRNKYFTTEYFTYYYTSVDLTTDPYTPSGELAVMELTEAGKQLEVLHVPSQIDGLPVTQFGLVRSETFRGTTSYRFESEKLKKLYLPNTIRTIDYGYQQSGMPNLETLLYPGMVDTSDWLCSLHPKIINGMSGPIIYFVAYNNFDNINDYRTNIGQPDVISIANVTFLWNFEGADNNGVYGIDQVGEEESIESPNIPAREGYIFKGWYREEDCVNKFDFTKGKVQIDEDLQTMLLYAKWEKQ